MWHQYRFRLPFRLKTKKKKNCAKSVKLNFQLFFTISKNKLET